MEGKSNEIRVIHFHVRTVVRTRKQKIFNASKVINIYIAYAYGLYVL